MATLAASSVHASVVSWDVDPALSYVRLTIPDQSIAVTNLGTVTFRMRDNGGTTQWTDGGGRQTALAGEIVTDYEDGNSITFLGGSHHVQALEATSLRPNPAAWDEVATNYTNTTSASAALGGRARASYLFITFDAAFIAFRTVQFDITNAAPNPIPITNGVIPADSTLCGIRSAVVDVDGVELPLGLGQPIPDLLHASLPPILETNAASGAITDLGGQVRRLTYPINIPDLTLDLNGMAIKGSVAGLVVANAEIPWPQTTPRLYLQCHGMEIVLTWPTNAADFSLEYTTKWPAPNWWSVLPPPVILNDLNVVTNAVTESAAFYRLHKP